MSVCEPVPLVLHAGQADEVFEKLKGDFMKDVIDSG